MGRPIGSLNRQKPFNSALLVELRSDPLALRRIAAKLIGRAQEGELAAIREIADRLDGRPVQMLDRRDLTPAELTDAELIAIAAGGLDELEEKTVLLLPPAAPKSKP